jgi:hypothetical protein
MRTVGANAASNILELHSKKMVLGGIVWTGCLLGWRAYLQDTGTRPILAIQGKSTHDYKAVALALGAVLALSSNCVQELSPSGWLASR